MLDSHIDNRKSIRPRVDNTALHRSTTLDETTTSQTLNLDVVSSKISVSVPSTLTVTIEGSIDGSNFFSIGTAITDDTISYSSNLVKKVRLTRTAGTGAVTVVGIPGGGGGDTLSGNVLDFPITGRMYNKNTLGVTDPLIIFEKPVGTSGVIREMQLIFEKSIGDLTSAYLNIKYDGQSTPAVSVSLSGLAGIEEQSTLLVSEYETAMWDLQSRDGEAESALILRYPIPYTNGIVVYLTGTAGGNWCNVLYQDSLPSSWNKNLRFYAKATSSSVAAISSGAGTITVTGTAVLGSGTNFSAAMVGKYLVLGVGGGNNEALITAVTDTTHMTIASDDAMTEAGGTAYSIGERHVVLERPAGSKGYFITAVAALGADNVAFLEADPRIFVDQEIEPSLQWSGTEDFFDQSFYFAGPLQRTYGGVTSLKTTDPSGVGAYKIFSKNPIPYNNGIEVVYPNIIDHVLINNWITVYYEEPIFIPETILSETLSVSETVTKVRV